MNIINMPRGAGKTFTLISLAAANGAYIVCRDKKAAERIFAAAQERELDIHFPITFKEFRDNRYHNAGIGSFMIDDVDDLLHFLSGVIITWATYTAA